MVVGKERKLSNDRGKQLSSKLEYIKRLVDATHINLNDFNIINALIFTLTPKEAINFFYLSFEQNYKVRQWTVKKIAKDIRNKYQSYHHKFISIMLDMLQKRPCSKRESYAYSLDLIYESLPKQEKDKRVFA